MRVCTQCNCNYASSYSHSILNIDLNRFDSLAWSVSFMLAKHILCNYIKN